MEASSPSEQRFTGSCRPGRVERGIAWFTEHILDKHPLIDWAFIAFLWILGAVVLLVFIIPVLIIAFLTRH